MRMPPTPQQTRAVANLPAASQGGQHRQPQRSLQTIYDTVTPSSSRRVADGADAAELTTATSSAPSSRMAAIYRPQGAGAGCPVTGFQTAHPSACRTTAPYRHRRLAGAIQAARFAYVPTIADTVEAALAYRENFSSRELMPIHGDWTAWDTAANASIKLMLPQEAAAAMCAPLIDKGDRLAQNPVERRRDRGRRHDQWPCSGILQDPIPRSACSTPTKSPP